MKALTLHQPWATLIALRVKTIETRSWRAPESLIGQRIAIHAGRRVAYLEEGGEAWERFDLDTYVATKYPARNISAEPLPLGCVVATARLDECLPVFDRFGSFATDENPLWAWAQDHGWVISNLRNRHLGSPFLQVNTPPVVGQRTGWCQSIIDDQLPYGDFAPGRWAWMLTDIEPLAKPIPAKGKQGLWNWNAS